ncbi:MAG: HAMP domain-containing histidine kinase [Clostridium sp.]|nr:HAMP domain-containing histidine kinase [Acetatifactor muris]MCM1528346.1 HAMP domain-containing histidine kinase [Bacteroides sp.]MCM1563941.1 HAMP domain-containing histidine kinase [Clostridium sp.]
MIRQLRTKFIIIAMCSLAAVLAVIVGGLNVMSYLGTVERADRILNMLADNEGRFPGRWERDDFRGFSPETPYDTRFFSVSLDEKGEVLSVDTGRIAAVETGEAMDYARAVWESGRTRGFKENYRFLSCGSHGASHGAEEPEGSRVIFVDCGRELDAFRNLLWGSICLALLGLVAVCVPVVVFSGKVFAPVEESYARQRRFITDASHELKTPLTVISANVDVLEMESGENRWTGSIRNQVNRLRRLTEQMVTLSRLEEQEKSAFVECDLSGIVAETAEMFEPLVSAAGKTLSLRIEPGIRRPGDEEKLRQMISLLLDNALKYASAQGEIRLYLEPERKGGRARLTLWNAVDEASGIRAGRQDVLFERFYRLDASRNSDTGGSGIGLSVVKAIAELHGGKAAAKSEDGRSITFTILI